MKKSYYIVLFLIAALAFAGPLPARAAATPAPLLLDDYVLTGAYTNGTVTFTLHARAKAPSWSDAEIPLLSGPVSLTAVPDSLARRLELRDGAIILKYGGWSALAVDVPFRAQVTEQDGWKTVQFTPAAANLRQLVLVGWPDAAKLDLPDASQPIRENGRIVASLSGSGPVTLRWKDAPPETAGKLFYSVEGAVVVTVAPGILEQTDQFTYHVLQGQLDHLEFAITGDGKVTGVEGPGILNWSELPGTGAPGGSDGPPPRRLVVQLNDPRTGEYPLTVRTQSPLPALPASATPPRVTPVGALNYGGRLRVQNEGAVRVEVLDPKGLSQIAPEQFASINNSATSTQAFAYRFADAGYAFSIHASNVLPELGVTSILTYHLGESDAYVEAEIQLDIREAPLRELNLLAPADWAVAAVDAPGLADYFVTPAASTTPASERLRLVFSQPLSGLQVVRLRLEHNASVTGDTWDIPVLAVENAKNTRGFVGVTADAGLRLTPRTTDGLNDAGATSFPIKVDNLQAAWRFRDAPWSASVHVERLAASVQADALQLFSIGEGVAYGSTVLNLQIAGAPVSVLRLQNTGGYRNLEFTGRDLLNWKQLADGTCEVYLHRPITGAYTLLATYELPCKATGDALPCAGLRPLDVQSEQGFVIVTSNHPVNLKPDKISAGLVRLETAEIPAEYRLLCDAPILAAYQYSARPFDATIDLTPLTPASTVDQVVDIAELNTRVSATGEWLTTARYLLKSKDHDHLRLTLPAAAKLWSVAVAGHDVVPVADQDVLLVPLPRQGDPNTPLLVEVKYAGAASQASSVTVTAPKLGPPVLVTDWRLTADQDHRLRPLDGAPVIETPRQTGFGWLGQLAFGTQYPDGKITFWTGLFLSVFSLILFRAMRARRGWVKKLGGLIGIAIGVAGLGCFVLLGLNASGQIDRAEFILNAVAPVHLPRIGVTPVAPNDPGAGNVLHLSIPVVPEDHALAFTFANELAPKTPSTTQPAAWFLLPGALLLLLARPDRSGLRGSPTFVVGLLFAFAGELALPNGPLWFCLTLAFIFAGFELRALRALRSTEPRPAFQPLPPGSTAAAATTAIAFLLWLGLAPKASAETPPTGLVLSVVQQGEVREDFARLRADVTWRAQDGATLTLLRGSAVLIAINGTSSDLVLTHQSVGDSTDYTLAARDSGTYKFSYTYEVRVDADSVSLPTPGGLVNQVTLDLARPDLTARADNAVSLQSVPGPDGRPRVTVNFPAGATPWLQWVPRSRDLSAEKPVYYVDWLQLYAPAAGLVDGRHEARVRIAQGEIKELAFAIPPGLSIADVQAGGLAAWRFDPEQHKLLAYFEPARRDGFTVTIRSQAATTPLPYQTALAPIRLDGAAGEVGLLAIATSQEVQLGSDTPDGLAHINLEDFPARLAEAAAPRGESLTVRRAYSFGAAAASLKLEALAVEPDVRVISRQTLSLGEDRVVLAAQLNVTVARAGIFQLSFPLPKGLELESLSGPDLSHWTELDSPDGPVITMYLKSKTMGETRFDATLSGPGIAARQEWTAPRLTLREAGKQTGELALLPELGLRPHILTRDGLTQLDPKQTGVNPEGALVFGLLQSDWKLSFDVEKIDPWIQVDVLQDVTVREGLTEIRANLNYQIDNAGVRELRLQFPPAAVGVRISGPQVSDTLPVPDQPGVWVVRLARRALGEENLDVSYQLLPDGKNDPLTLTGLQALDANLQRGYLTLRARGRLETRVSNPPPALQPADWETIPAELRRNLDNTAASQTFRVVDAAFTLPVTVVTHEVAEVLPARVISASLRTLASRDGQLLTNASIQLFPGDKRYLHLKLPADARFWFAFVNDRGVTPSRVGDEILLPLEPNPLAGEPATIEFLYAQPLSPLGAWSSAAFTGPRFDLPLENISWKIFLPESWTLRDWSGPWQKINVPPSATPAAISLDDYLAGEQTRDLAQTQEAENFLSAGNQLLQQGQQQQARDLFSNAYQISQHDAAFNEDARVQWQNLREQQALVGLANRRNWFGSNNGNTANGLNQIGQNGGGGGESPILSQTEVLNYTDDQARKILNSNGAEDNAVLAKLAERLVQQQTATLPQPAAIRATLPERGPAYEFTQSLQVNPWSDLSLKLTAGPARTTAWTSLAALGALAATLLAATGLTRRNPAI
jgi:hypothetical protein